MTSLVVYPDGKATILVPVTNSIAVYTNGDDYAKVSKIVGFPNQPSAVMFIGFVSQEQTVFGPFDIDTEIVIETGADPAYYLVGADPSVNINFPKNTGTTTTLNDCKYAATSKFAAVYDNGTLGVGATLTATVDGSLSIDGSSPSVSDRILLTSQPTSDENGIFTVTNNGGVSSRAVLTRATDFDRASEMQINSSTYIELGVSNAGKTYYQTSPSVVTVGVDPITFSSRGAQLGTMAFQNSNAVNETGGVSNGVVRGDLCVTANIATTYSINPALGNAFNLTATDDCVISVDTAPSSPISQRISLQITSNGKAVTFSGPNLYTLDQPIIDTQNTPNLLELISVGGNWYVAPISQNHQMVTIASASNINLDKYGANLFVVTGTATIDSITSYSGIERTIIFDDACTLVNSPGLSIQLPGSGNIVTATGDVAKFIGYAANENGTVYCTSYTRNSGKPLFISPTQFIGPLITAVTDGEWTLIPALNSSSSKMLITSFGQECLSAATPGTFTVKINGVAVTGLVDIPVSTTYAATAATALNTINPGDRVTIEFAGTISVMNFLSSLMVTPI